MPEPGQFEPGQGEPGGPQGGTGSRAIVTQTWTLTVSAAALRTARQAYTLTVSAYYANAQQSFSLTVSLPVLPVTETGKFRFSNLSKPGIKLS